MNIDTPITIDSSYSEIEAAYYNISYPVRPVRPATISLKSAADYRLYADLITSYENEVVEYTNAREAFNAARNELMNVWNAKLRAEYSHLNDLTYDAVYAKAYEDGHSSGLHEIRNSMDDIADFAEKIINFNCK